MNSAPGPGHPSRGAARHGPRLMIDDADHDSASARLLAHVTALAVAELDGLVERDIELFTGRLARWLTHLIEGWKVAYGTHPDATDGLDRLIRALAGHYRERRPALRALDLERIRRPDWFQDPSMIGYVCYPARFAGSIAGVRAAPRLPPGAAGPLPPPHAAAADARRGDRRGLRGRGLPSRSIRASGSIDDLEHLCDELRGRGMSLCVDLVLNHTAAEHPWAIAARAGDRGGRGDVPDLPGSDDARPLRADPARGVPGPRPGQLHPARGRPVGLDDVQRASSGTSTGRTRRSSSR